MWLRNLTVYCIVKRVLEPNLTQHMVIHILHTSWQFTDEWDGMWLRNLIVYCIVKHVLEPNLTQHMVIHILHISWQFTAKWDIIDSIIYTPNFGHTSLAILQSCRF